jgi:hypothetical protein
VPNAIPPERVERSSRTPQIFDLDVRHFIYATFANAARPPTTQQVAEHFGTSIAAVEDAFGRLADAHHIALAPGSSSIWMAHPFSGLPTNYVTQTADAKYWAN